MAVMAGLPAGVLGLPGLPGLDVGGLVEDVVRKLVDLVVPDLAAHWAVALVTWLVALPDLTNADAYPHLTAVRHALVSVGFGLLACTLAASGLHTLLGRPSGALGLQRAAVAAVVMTATTQLASTAVTAVNITTGALITQPSVRDGIDTMLGAALIVGAVTSGLTLGLTIGAALAGLFFMAALIIMKIGLTALQALLLLSAPLVWGLYPLASTAWLAHTWTRGAAAIALVPVAWALVFTAGALLSADSTLWSTTDGAGLPDQLQQLVKPLAAVACFWLAYRAPGFLLAAARTIGLHPIVASRASTGPTTPRPAGGAGRSGVHTNAQRFTRVTPNAPVATPRTGRPSPPRAPTSAHRTAGPAATSVPGTTPTSRRARPAASHRPAASPAASPGQTTRAPTSSRRHAPRPATPAAGTNPATTPTPAPPRSRKAHRSGSPTTPPSPPGARRPPATPGRASGTPGPHPVPRPSDTSRPARTPAPPATPTRLQPPPDRRTPPPTATPARHPSTPPSTRRPSSPRAR